MIEKRVIAIGDFDGVHKGHQALFQQLIEWGASLQAEPMVLSFDVNTKGKKRITSPAVREELLRSLGICGMMILPFDEWKEISAEEFTDSLLREKLGVVGLVCGEDFHFGKGREGNEFTLISKGIAVKKLKNTLLDDLRISSSSIRECIETGDLERAEAQMGHPLILVGEVIHGKGLAHQYSTPTLNLPVEQDQLLPPFGVYAAWVYLDEARYPAAVNIGVRPTVEKEGIPNLEAHLLGCEGDLYGRKVRVELKSYIRKEACFESEQALFEQIKKDGEICKARLEKME